jgi:hypothetical protein
MLAGKELRSDVEKAAAENAKKKAAKVHLRQVL